MVAPSHRRAVGAETGSELMPRRGPVLVVPDVVLPAPDHLDRHAHRLGNLAGFRRRNPFRDRRPNPPPRWVVCTVTAPTGTPQARAATPRVPPPSILGPAWNWVGTQTVTRVGPHVARCSSSAPWWRGRDRAPRTPPPGCARQIRELAARPMLRATLPGSRPSSSRRALIPASSSARERAFVPLDRRARPGRPGRGIVLRRPPPRPARSATTSRTPGTARAAAVVHRAKRPAEHRAARHDRHQRPRRHGVHPEDRPPPSPWSAVIEPRHRLADEPELIGGLEPHRPGSGTGTDAPPRPRPRRSAPAAHRAPPPSRSRCCIAPARTPHPAAAAVTSMLRARAAASRSGSQAARHAGAPAGELHSADQRVVVGLVGGRELDSGPWTSRRRALPRPAWAARWRRPAPSRSGPPSR